MSEDAIFDLYRSLTLWTNPVCKKCRTAANPELLGPVSIWQVGRNFEVDPYRLVFIGKTARGGVDIETLDHLARWGFIDATAEADELIANYGWPYWRYTAAIIERLYGSVDEGWERIAFTNLVKCNNSYGSDTTSQETAENCLVKLGVVWKELSILRPKHVIFYTHLWYDDFIDQFTSQWPYVDKTSRQHALVTGGKRNMLWWERDCVVNGPDTTRFLRTSHPQGQIKDFFVTRLVDWIKR